jgi:hypothetical protein
MEMLSQNRTGWVSLARTFAQAYVAHLAGETPLALKGTGRGSGKGGGLKVALSPTRSLALASDTSSVSMSIQRLDLSPRALCLGVGYAF